MINNIDELIELIDVYHTWVKRLLISLVAFGLAYGGYKYGMNKGFDQGAQAAVNYMERQKAEGGATSSLPLSDGQPGKMWVPEA